MPRTSAATRSRLIGAAIAEFAEHGLAGARVDRIASAAAANKRAIYDYFTSKEGLFDAALLRVIGDLNDAVPLREDLPRYAAELFDYLMAHPEAVRMIAWRRLERPQAGPGLSDAFTEQVMAVRDQSDPAAIGPADLVILVIGLANAWSLSASDLLPAAGQDPADPRRIALHRAAVIEAARRMGGISGRELADGAAGVPVSRSPGSLGHC
jgi:AcrR family transcriptional regulator